MSDFKFTNSDQPLPAPHELRSSFKVKANPSTDIWSKLPSTERFNAPILHKTVPLSSFRKARAHISADWNTLYDQGGLILVLNRGESRKWIKTGIEYVDGKARVSTVSKDRAADWSLLPIPESSTRAVQGVTIEMNKREEDGTLWIYLIGGEGGDETRVPVREVTWAFEEEEATECWVGVYACRPAKDDGLGELEVTFSRLEIELSE